MGSETDYIPTLIVSLFPSLALALAILAPLPNAWELFINSKSNKTEVLTLSAHNLEKMMTTPYHQHSIIPIAVLAAVFLDLCLNLCIHALFPLYCTCLAFEMNFEL